MTRSAVTRLLNVVSLVAIFLAGFIPTIPHLSHDWGIGLTALFMAVAGAATTWKQRLSIEIKDVAIIPTILVTAVGLLGGLGDFFSAIPLDPETKEQVRWAVLAIIGIINACSKGWFPTFESKVIESEKQRLAK